MEQYKLAVGDDVAGAADPASIKEAYAGDDGDRWFKASAEEVPQPGRAAGIPT